MASDDYVFTRDYIDNNRINLLHGLWTKTWGYVLHPRIPTDKPDLRVADVGTGTGIWLFDVREQLPPSARLEGFDISFDAVPHAATLPSNVSFRHWNVKEDLPEDLVGAFDIVHVRFLAFVVLDEEIRAVVDRLFKMLKPGGYLQWGEPDLTTLRVDKAGDDVAADSVAALFGLFGTQQGDARMRPGWCAQLGEHFSAAGFADVAADRLEPAPHWSYVFHEAGLMMFELIIPRKEAGGEAMRREVERLLPLAVAETRRGAWVASVRVSVVGRKPAV